MTASSQTKQATPERIELVMVGGATFTLTRTEEEDERWLVTDASEPPSSRLNAASYIGSYLWSGDRPDTWSTRILVSLQRAVNHLESQKE